MNNNGNGRAVKITAVEDERLANKPTTLLECERRAHDWEDVLVGGRKALVVYEKVGRTVTKVAEVVKCARCFTVRRSIFWLDGYVFIEHKYGDRPEGATPTHVDGAPRLTKADKHQAYAARESSKWVLVDA